MLCSPSSRVAVLAALGVALTASAASAQPAQVPVGEQRLTAGLVVSPTLGHDPDAPGRGLTRHFVGGGLRARLGLQHVLAANFVMGVELDLGAAWWPPTRMAVDGYSPGGAAVAWQAGMLGRFVPRGDLSGASYGLGLHVFRTKTPESGLLSLAAEPRFGWYLWREDSFVLPEISYALALVEGYQSTLAEGEPQAKPPTLHRVTIGFTFGF